MQLNVSDSNDGITVYTQVGGFLSQINTMYIPDSIYGTAGLYVNRLIVHPTSRNRGIATKLLKKLTEIADKKGVNIILEINPYGDLDLKQLQQFYKKHGFEEHSIQGVYVRYVKQN